VNSSADQRGAPRARLTVDAPCSVTPGTWPQVWLTDLSLSGCRLKVPGSPFSAGHRAVVNVKRLDGLSGTVVWSHRGAVGIRFDKPLHEAVRLFLLSAPMADTTGFSNLSDHFGRPLPPWPSRRR
jgi:hypothetical protein